MKERDKNILRWIGFIPVSLIAGALAMTILNYFIILGNKAVVLWLPEFLGWKTLFLFMIDWFCVPGVVTAWVLIAIIVAQEIAPNEKVALYVMWALLMGICVIFGYLHQQSWSSQLALWYFISIPLLLWYLKNTD